MLVIKCSICECEFVYQNDEDSIIPQKPVVMKFVGGGINQDTDAGSVMPANTTQASQEKKTLIYLRCPNGHLRPYWAYLTEKSEPARKGLRKLFKKKRRTEYCISKITSIPPVHIENTELVSAGTVDDIFWLEDMKSCMKDVWTLQRDAAEKLSTFVTWLWTGYTTTFGISAFLFSDRINGAPWYLTVCMIAPIVLLPFAYYFCVRARMPHEESILDYRIPESIEESNMNLLRKKSKSFRLAGVVTFIAIIAFITAILSFLYLQASQNFVEAGFGENKSEIVITGRVPSGSALNIGIESWKNDRTARMDTSLTYVNTGGCAFNLYFPLKDSCSEYTVLVFWKTKDKEMSYAKTLKK